MPLQSAFEIIWHSLSARTTRPTERDFLRSIHHNPELSFWTYCLNLEIQNKGLSPVSVSSIWVDHTPQCWYKYSKGKWSKPSCELADLLIITWDNQQRKSGRAILVQAKRGKSHNSIPISNSSTKKELNLLGNAPKFLLSSQLSVASGNAPKPLNPNVNCEFQLSPYSGKRLNHCTFLQVKDVVAKRWPSQTLSWQTMWPPSAYPEPYSKAIVDMVSGYHGAMGERFIYGNLHNDWDRLVTVLINETLAGCGGTAKGQKQHTAFYFSETEQSLWGSAGNDIPHSDDPQGISTIFIAPEHER